MTLAADDTVPNKDFILRYQVAGARPDFAVLAHRATAAPAGSFFLLAQPPETAAAADITPREMVFVVDTSSSMAGEPLAKAKEVVRRALATMGPDDTFQIIRFDDRAGALGARPARQPPAQRHPRARLARRAGAGRRHGDDDGHGGGARLPARSGAAAHRRVPDRRLHRQRGRRAARCRRAARPIAAVLLRRRLGGEPLPAGRDGAHRARRGRRRAPRRGHARRHREVPRPHRAAAAHRRQHRLGWPGRARPGAGGDPRPVPGPAAGGRRPLRAAAAARQ